jgi:3-dehydroquinate dehydratase/shikimate dehydrogenase
MLTVSIQGKFNEAKEAIRVANQLAQCIEFRIDLMEHMSLKAISQLKRLSHLPVIFTLRKREHGGRYLGTEKNREKKFLELITLKPDYIDLEWDAPFSFERNTIVSYHNFQETPKDLEAVLKKMRTKKGVIYKLATQAHSSLDSLRMLTLVQKEKDVAGMCMGKEGEITRILAPIVESPLTYSYFGHQKIPGQVPLDKLRSIYRFDDLNRFTKIYALIGDPIEQSIGHLVHNDQFQKGQFNGVYVKIRLVEKELSSFFELIRSLPFEGISVTMPLKEKVMPQTEKIGAINTLVKHQGEWIGLTTDGKGALDALEKRGKVRGKVVLILGAGGTAQAIALEATRRGGKVVIANRNLAKGKYLAQQIGGRAIAFHEIKDCLYDIVINATSVGMSDKKDETPIPLNMIREKTIALDVILSHKKTYFLSLVEEKKGEGINGIEMFAHQALGQLQAWNIPIDNEAAFFAYVLGI